MDFLKQAANHFENLPEDQKKIFSENNMREMTKMLMSQFFSESYSLLLLLFEEQKKWIKYEVQNKITKKKKLKVIEKKANEVQRILNEPAFKGAIVPYLDMNIFDVLNDVNSKMEKLKVILPKEQTPIDEVGLLFPEILKTIEENGTFGKSNHVSLYKNLKELLIASGYNESFVEVTSVEKNPIALMVIPLAFADQFVDQLSFLKEYYWEVNGDFENIFSKPNKGSINMENSELSDLEPNREKNEKVKDENSETDKILITIKEHAQKAVIDDLKDYIKKGSRDNFELSIKGKNINEPIVFLGYGSVLAFAIQELKKRKLIIDDIPKIKEWLFQNFKYEYGNPPTISLLSKATIESYFVNGRKPKKNSQIELNEVLKLKTA